VKSHPLRRSETPSIATCLRRNAGRDPLPESGHVSFRFGGGADDTSHAAPHTFVCSSSGLGARPQTLPNRVKWRCVRFSAPATGGRLLQRLHDARARPRASDPRSRRREGVFAPAPVRPPPLPARSLRIVRRATAPAFRREQAASHSRTFAAVSRAAQDGREMRQRRPPLVETPLARRHPSPIVGCTENGRDSDCVRQWVDSPERRCLPPPGRSRERARGSPPPKRIEHPVVAGTS